MGLNEGGVEEGTRWNAVAHGLLTSQRGIDMMTSTAAEGERIMLKWEDKFLVGIEDVDFQHRYFATLINRLAQRLPDARHCRENHAGRGCTCGQGLIQELTAYAQFHFLSEENIMAELGYPDLVEHHRLHSSLIEQLSVKIMSFPDFEDGDGLVKFLEEWFINHTVTEDRKIGEFARRR